MSARRHTPDPGSTPVLRVHTDDGRAFRFAQAFQAGRGHDCEVRIYHGEVSRHHLEVSFDDGQWTVHDLDSGNGVFVDGDRVDVAPVEGTLTVTLGLDGPALTFEVEAVAATRRTARTPPAPGAGDSGVRQQIRQKYFGPEDAAAPAGPQTMFVRKVLKEHHQRQWQWFTVVVSTLVVALAATGGYAYYKHRQLQQQRATAVNLFYAMKALDFDIANVERTLAGSGNTQGDEQIRSYRERRREMERNYDRLLVSLNVYSRKLTEQERLILRVTRLFGECELAAPPEYLDEVTSYIGKWQVVRPLCPGGEAGRGEGVYQADRRGVHRAEPAAAVLLSGDAGERLQAFCQRTANLHGAMPRACGSSSPRPGQALRSDDRTAGRRAAARSRPTIAISGTRRRPPPHATSRTSTPPMRRRRACW